MNKRSKLTVILLSSVIVGMLGLSFAAEPLYSAFCKVTGFGGTTQIAVEKPKEILERGVRVAFDANVAKNAPLKFRPLSSIHRSLWQPRCPSSLRCAPTKSTAPSNSSPRRIILRVRLWKLSPSSSRTASTSKFLPVPKFSYGRFQKRQEPLPSCSRTNG